MKNRKNEAENDNAGDIYHAAKMSIFIPKVIISCLLLISIETNLRIEVSAYWTIISKIENKNEYDKKLLITFFEIGIIATSSLIEVSREVLILKFLSA